KVQLLRFQLQSSSLHLWVFPPERDARKGTSDCPSEVVQKPVPTVWQKSFAQVVTEKQSQQPPVVFMTLKSHRPVTADVPDRLVSATPATFWKSPQT
uniref:Uncharacterized protein n=1 Tax=Oryzias latipes TaxID=8090 RepID=A0A3P9IZE1_ORYLA